ncbi:MAG: DUF1361 domain-containing protein [Cytophagales bacterium]|nr:DUF1361 domain-containing protein [Cytophaga sp.]
MNKKLVVCTSLSLLLLAARMGYSSSLSYVFLAWNLLLAFIPYLISTTIHSGKLKGIIVFPAGIIWLLFLPNALYIITDFKHLRERPFIPVWYDCLLLFSFSALALLFGLLSFYHVNQVLKRYLSKPFQHILLVFISIITGFGVYLGRVERWNSWDFFTHTPDLVSESLILMTKPYVWLFSLTYGLAFLFMYYIILSLINFRHETPRQLV